MGGCKEADVSLLSVSHTPKEKPGQEGGVSSLSPRVSNGLESLALPDSVLGSLFLSGSVGPPCLSLLLSVLLYYVSPPQAHCLVL